MSSSAPSVPQLIELVRSVLSLDSNDASAIHWQYAADALEALSVLEHHRQRLALLAHRALESPQIAPSLTGKVADGLRKQLASKKRERHRFALLLTAWRRQHLLSLYATESNTAQLARLRQSYFVGPAALPGVDIYGSHPERLDNEELKALLTSNELFATLETATEAWRAAGRPAKRKPQALRDEEDRAPLQKMIEVTSKWIKAIEKADKLWQAVEEACSSLKASLARPLSAPAEVENPSALPPRRSTKPVERNTIERQRPQPPPQLPFPAVPQPIASSSRVRIEDLPPLPRQTAAFYEDMPPAPQPPVREKRKAPAEDKLPPRRPEHHSTTPLFVVEVPIAPVPPVKPVKQAPAVVVVVPPSATPPSPPASPPRRAQQQQTVVPSVAIQPATDSIVASQSQESLGTPTVSSSSQNNRSNGDSAASVLVLEQVVSVPSGEAAAQVQKLAAEGVKAKVLAPSSQETLDEAILQPESQQAQHVTRSARKSEQASAQKASRVRQPAPPSQLTMDPPFGELLGYMADRAARFAHPRAGWREKVVLPPLTDSPLPPPVVTPLPNDGDAFDDAVPTVIPAKRRREPPPPIDFEPPDRSTFQQHARHHGFDAMRNALRDQTLRDYIKRVIEWKQERGMPVDMSMPPRFEDWVFEGDDVEPRLRDDYEPDMSDTYSRAADDAAMRVDEESLSTLLSVRSLEENGGRSMQALAEEAVMAIRSPSPSTPNAAMPGMDDDDEPPPPGGQLPRAQDSDPPTSSYQLPPSRQPVRPRPSPSTQPTQPSSSAQQLSPPSPPLEVFNNIADDSSDAIAASLLPMPAMPRRPSFLDQSMTPSPDLAAQQDKDAFKAVESFLEAEHGDARLYG